MGSNHTAPFVALPFHVLSAAGRHALREYVLARPQDAREHLDTRTRARTSQWYYPSRLVVERLGEDVARLRAVSPLPFTVDLIYLPPGAQVARHVDGAKHARSCVMATPLYPAQGYAPTLYWADMQATAPSHVVTWGDLPVLLDIQRPHSLGNPAEVPRFNVQLAFGAPFAVVRELLLNGALDCLRPSKDRL